MGLINAADLPAPELPFEDVDCPPLGGQVRVRALMLHDRLGMEARLSAVGKLADAPESTRYKVIADMLAISVVDAKDQPVFSVHRWGIFGTQHAALALELFNVAWRLSGMSGEDTKKN